MRSTVSTFDFFASWRSIPAARSLELCLSTSVCCFLTRFFPLWVAIVSALRVCCVCKCVCKCVQLPISNAVNVSVTVLLVLTSHVSISVQPPTPAENRMPFEKNKTAQPIKIGFAVINSLSSCQESIHATKQQARFILPFNSWERWAEALSKALTYCGALKSKHASLRVSRWAPYPFRIMLVTRTNCGAVRRTMRGRGRQYVIVNTCANRAHTLWISTVAAGAFLLSRSRGFHARRNNFLVKGSRRFATARRRRSSGSVRLSTACKQSNIYCPVFAQTAKSPVNYDKQAGVLLFCLTLPLWRHNRTLDAFVLRRRSRRRNLVDVSGLRGRIPQHSRPQEPHAHPRWRKTL